MIPSSVDPILICGKFPFVVYNLHTYAVFLRSPYLGALFPTLYSPFVCASLEIIDGPVAAVFQAPHSVSQLVYAPDKEFIVPAVCQECEDES